MAISGLGPVDAYVGRAHGACQVAGRGAVGATPDSAREEGRVAAVLVVLRRVGTRIQGVLARLCVVVRVKSTHAVPCGVRCDIWGEMGSRVHYARRRVAALSAGGEGCLGTPYANGCPGIRVVIAARKMGAVAATWALIRPKEVVARLDRRRAIGGGLATTRELTATRVQVSDRALTAFVPASLRPTPCLLAGCGRFLGFRPCTI